MSYYECVFIVRQDVSSGQVDQLVEDYTKIIEDNGGQVASKELWGLRTLAYRIKKNRKGHYVLFNIDAPATAVHEMERNMRISEDVLRYLTIKTEKLETGPSPIMQSRNRDDRGPRRGPPRSGDGPPRSGDGPPSDRPKPAESKPAAPKPAETKASEAPAATPSEEGAAV